MAEKKDTKVKTKKRPMSEIEAVKAMPTPPPERPKEVPMKVDAYGRPLPTPLMQKPLTSAVPPVFKKGGKVKKTGMAKVHKGEVVLTEKQAKKLPRSMGGKGMGGGGPVGGKCPKTGAPKRGRGPKK